MAEESQSAESLNVGGIDYMLFLILILILLSNQNTFGQYFETFNTEVDKVSKMIKSLSATAEGLKSAFITPQKVKEDLNLF